MTTNGKIAFITGGSRGIGAAIVTLLAQSGYDVHFTYSRSSTEADRLAQQLKADNYHVIAHQLNASKPDTMRPFAERFIERYGAPHVLVHNAGVVVHGTIGMHKDAQYHQSFSVNTESIFTLTNAFALHLPDHARIIAISSVLGERAREANMGLYNASKFAVNGFVRSWAFDLGHRAITVNAILPGPIDTDMNPDNGNQGAEDAKATTALRRYGKPEEIAQTVKFLASPDASYITGATLRVDGGLNA